MGEYMYKSKESKSLRVKFVRQMVMQISEDFMWDENPNKFKDILETKLKETFSFKCDLVSYEIINNEIFIEFGVERENGKILILNFCLSPSTSNK